MTEVNDFSYGNIIVIQYSDNYVSFKRYKRNTMVFITNGIVRVLPRETQIGIVCAVGASSSLYCDFGKHSYITYWDSDCVLRKPTASEILELKYKIRKSRVRYNHKLKKFVDCKYKIVK